MLYTIIIFIIIYIVTQLPKSLTPTLTEMQLSLSKKKPSNDLQRFYNGMVGIGRYHEKDAPCKTKLVAEMDGMPAEREAASQKEINQLK